MSNCRFANRDYTAIVGCRVLVWITSFSEFTMSNMASATSSLFSSWNTLPSWKYPTDVRMSSMPYVSDAW